MLGGEQVDNPPQEESAPKEFLHHAYHDACANDSKNDPPVQPRSQELGTSIEQAMARGKMPTVMQCDPPISTFSPPGAQESPSGADAFHEAIRC